MDCSPRWVDTTIHPLAYSRPIRDEGKVIRKALFRVLKYVPPLILLCTIPPQVDRPADGTTLDLGILTTLTGTNAS